VKTIFAKIFSLFNKNSQNNNINIINNKVMEIDDIFQMLNNFSIDDINSLSVIENKVYFLNKSICAILKRYHIKGLKDTVDTVKSVSSFLRGVEHVIELIKNDKAIEIDDDTKENVLNLLQDQKQKILKEGIH